MDLDTLRIADFPDIEIVARMRETNYEKFKSLVRMHLSFELDLNTDEFDLPCHEIVYEDKGKLKKWNRMSKKHHKGIATGSTCGAYSKGAASAGNSPTEGLQQQIDAGFMFHLQELKQFLLQEKNVTQEGLFRKTGSASRQNELRLQIQNDKPLDLTGGGYSAHDCATVFKGYLAELPEPLLTDAHYPAHLQIAPLCLTASANSNFEASSSGSKKPPNPERLKREQHLLNSVQLLLLLLPIENRQLTQHIIEMLHIVAKHSEANKMTAENLATLFAPHLICPRNLPPEALHYVAKRMSSIIAYLIRKGSAVFEVPAKLSTDICAYFMERKRKKTMSPEHTLDESISDISTVNTVYTFVDREKTAAAHTANNTDTELAQLYAHIQSMPESSKKRRLIKQFNKQNGQGTPLQLVVMNRLKNSEATRSAKSIGDSIKKHIFHKSLMSRTPKRTNLPAPMGLETPNFSSTKNPKLRVLFQSPAPTTTNTPRISVSSSTSSSITPLALNCASKSSNYASMSSASCTASSSKQYSLCNNNSPYTLKKHPLQKSISSSSLLTSSSYQPEEEGITKICSSSSSSSCAGSSCSSDDFVLQVSSKPSNSAPVSRQTSSDLHAAASLSSSSSMSNSSTQHFQHLNPNCCVTPLKIISDAAKNLICVGGGMEKKSVAWDDNHLLTVDELSNPCTPISRTTTGSDLKSRYKSEPNLSHFIQDKLGSDTTDSQLQITPICKSKSLTRKLMKGVSMGNLKFPFSTPETTKRLVRSVSATLKRQPAEESTVESEALLQADNTELDLDDETFEEEPDDHVSKDVDNNDDDDDDGDDDDEDESCEENEVFNAHTDISMFTGGGSSSSSELPGASVAGYQHLLHNSSVYRNMDIITSTPSLLLGRRSMSPITKSTQRMPKAMQESIMTPRSRKPVMMVTNTLVRGSSDQNLTICQPDLTSFREQDEEDSLTSAEIDNHGQSQPKTQPLNIDEDALDGYSGFSNKQHQDLPKSNIIESQPDPLTNALTSNFKEYLLSRSVLTASPVDSSFSSQPDDFAAPHDVEDLDTSLSSSLLYCLDGNRPDEEKIVVSENATASTAVANDRSNDKSNPSIPTIGNTRFNRLSTNPFIIINNARKRAATNDLEKHARPANNSNTSIANASNSSSSSSSSHTSINTTVTSGTKNANKENYEQSQSYLVSKKVLITDFPGETSF